MCPICGANCRCKNAGPDGLCCSCHRHKARSIYSQTTSDVVDRHQEAWEQRRLEQDKQRVWMRDV